MLGKISEATVNAGLLSWKLQPLAVRESYPDFIQNTYYTAELVTSDITKWQFKLEVPEPLPIDEIQAYAVVSYTQDNKKIKHRFKLRITHVEMIQENENNHRYTFQLPEDSVEFFEKAKSLSFSKQAEYVDFYLIQPLFEHIKTPIKGSKLTYGLLPEYGFYSVGELMRKLIYLDDEKWLKFCENRHYLYDKTSACGQIELQDISDN